jgi:hypothetical protein
MAFLGQKENGVAIETLGTVGGVSIISDRMCEVAIPLTENLQHHQKDLQY